MLTVLTLSLNPKPCILNHRAVQVDSVKHCVETAFGFSA